MAFYGQNRLGEKAVCRASLIGGTVEAVGAGSGSETSLGRGPGGLRGRGGCVIAVRSCHKTCGSEAGVGAGGGGSARRGGRATLRTTKRRGRSSSLDKGVPKREFCLDRRSGCGRGEGGRVQDVASWAGVVGSGEMSRHRNSLPNGSHSLLTPLRVRVGPAESSSVYTKSQQ